MKILSICLFALLFFFQAALGFHFAHARTFAGSRGHGSGGPEGPPPGGPPPGPPGGPHGGPPAPPNATSSR